MTVKEAYVKVTSTVKNMVVESCYEYDTLFVFNMTPPNYRPSKPNDILMDSSYFVNKKTGKVGVFQPFQIPLEEYKRGKKVMNYKEV